MLVQRHLLESSKNYSRNHFHREIENKEIFATLIDARDGWPQKPRKKTCKNNNNKELIICCVCIRSSLSKYSVQFYSCYCVSICCLNDVNMRWTMIIEFDVPIYKLEKFISFHTDLVLRASANAFCILISGATSTPITWESLIENYYSSVHRSLRPHVPIQSTRDSHKNYFLQAGCRWSLIRVSCSCIFARNVPFCVEHSAKSRNWGNKGQRKNHENSWNAINIKCIEIHSMNASILKIVRDF